MGKKDLELLEAQGLQLYYWGSDKERDIPIKQGMLSLKKENGKFYDKRKDNLRLIVGYFRQTG